MRLAATAQPTAQSLQWGHGGDAVEIGIERSAKYAAQALQWGHGGDAVEIPVFSPTTFSPKELQWGHGGDAVEMRQRPSGPRSARHFNGATAVTPWKFDLPFSFFDESHTLQWGHGGDAVEMAPQGEGSGHALLLQWGHGGDAVEMVDLTVTAKIAG